MFIYEVYIISEYLEKSRKEFWNTKYHSLYDQCKNIFDNEPDKIKISCYDKNMNKYNYFAYDFL